MTKNLECIACGSRLKTELQNVFNTRFGIENVLKGEISFVGPRPPIPAEVDEYEIRQRRRLSMKPGLTCLWQIASNRHDMSFDEWMKMDLRFIDNWSLGLDFKILFKTLAVVLRREGR
jgi:lipopolysaccharide/colanic/teichoic acid biosynthesis glycosyltransferase